jgi:hypothetical protein
MSGHLVIARLNLGVLVAIWRKLPLAAADQRLRTAGKPAKVAIVATMRKLLTIHNAIIQNTTAWRAAWSLKPNAHNVPSLRRTPNRRTRQRSQGREPPQAVDRKAQPVCWACPAAWG